MTQQKSKNGMRTFTIIWVGQLVSLMGGTLFTFAVGIWLLQKTGSVTLFALTLFFDTLPVILVAPYAGVIADRYDRRKLMILGDSGAALSTLIVALIIWSNTDLLWPLYAALVLGSVANTFQWPAYHASIAMLAPKEQLGRVNGMIQMAQALSMILGPLLGGILVTTIGIASVIFIDFATFLFAISTLALVRIPMPKQTPAEDGEKSSIWQEMFYGWNYIKARKGLLSLLIFIAILNLLATGINALNLPLILGFASEAVAGTVLSVGGAGLFLGGLAMTKWGGPKRRVYGVIWGSFVAGLFLLFYGIYPSAILVAIGAFGFMFCYPIIGASVATIWQMKVDLEAQGRVFSTRRVIGQVTQPLALLAAGPLADYLFEPWLASSDAPLADSVGRVIGVGAGRGIALMFLLMGASIMVVSLASYFYPRLRFVEEELPDAIPDTQTEAVVTDEVDAGVQEPVAA